MCFESCVWPARLLFARFIRCRGGGGGVVLFRLAAADSLFAFAQLGILLRLLQAVSFSSLLVVVRFERHHSLLRASGQSADPQYNFSRVYPAARLADSP